jgi:LysM repeat protein
MKRISVGLLCLVLVWAGLVAGCTKEKPGARAPEVSPTAAVAAAEEEGGVVSTLPGAPMLGAQAVPEPVVVETPTEILGPAAPEPPADVTLPGVEEGGAIPTPTPTVAPEVTTISVQPTATTNAFGELIGPPATATPTTTATPVPVLTAQPAIGTPVPSGTELPPVVPVATGGAPVPGFEPAPVGLSYEVRWGDTLYSIAVRFGVTVEAITTANHLNGDIIVVGQKLVIPGATSPVPMPNDGNDASPVHLVQPGETLSSIASLYNTTVDAIVQANGISNLGYIYVGQQLIIPPSQVSPAEAAPQPGGTYVVQAGDTLYSISVRFKTTVQALMVMNNLGNANLLYPGQVLRVP